MNTTTHDLRPLSPPQRHQLAFQCFDALAQGESFEFINDHEPRGLLMQFHACRPKAFHWQVVQGAPGFWRIRLSRAAAGEATLPMPQSGGCGCGGAGGCS